MDLEQIYETYFKSVYLYMWRLSGNEHLAEEITSETFFKAIKSIESFRGECDMRIWLCQIAKNTYYSYIKKRDKTLSVAETELQDVVDTDAFIAEQIIAKEEVQQIRKFLHELPDPYKEVFMWRVFGELSFKAIGDLYNKTDNWACVTYHRARKMIKGRLEEIGNEK